MASSFCSRSEHDFSNRYFHHLGMNSVTPHNAEPRPGGERTIRSVSILLVASCVGPAIAFLATPILTRLYSPADFGLFALFASAVAVIGSVVTLRFDVAIALPKRDSAATRVVGLSLIATLAISVAAALLTLLVGPLLAGLLQQNISWLWLGLLPLAVLATGIQLTFRYWATRNGRFVTVAIAGVSISIVAVLTQLLLAEFTSFGAGGLMLGMTAGLCCAALLLAFSARHIGGRLAQVSWRRLRATARQHADMPRYAVQTNMLNAASAALLPWSMALSFGPQYAGFVLLAERVIGRPMRMVSDSIWQVTHSSLPKLEGNARRQRIGQVHQFVALLLAFPTAFICFYPQMIPIILGDGWSKTLPFVPWLAIAFFLNALSNSTSYFVVFGKNREQMIFNVLLIVLRFSTLTIGPFFLNEVRTIALYSIVSSLMYASINIYWGLHINQLGRFACNIGASLSLGCVLALASRWLGGVTWQATLATVGLAFVLYCGLGIFYTWRNRVAANP